jgi:hypothetical protein
VPATTAVKTHTGTLNATTNGAATTLSAGSGRDAGTATPDGGSGELTQDARKGEISKIADNVLIRFPLRRMIASTDYSGAIRYHT